MTKRCREESTWGHHRQPFRSPGLHDFLLPAFENLLQAYLPLIHMIEESGMGIHISEGRLNLTPPQKRTL